ncbi:unnamed protein product [Acanthoscelides obtectus]|uniref:Uncharacterized protein n=1 Tax=Acanthoscelides obtectus TaxID=200917 RepID=A0A9P0P7Q7_ACAOB|nr:unnamed protein product [Acanthoscelides obtectus]CAK1668751.1 SCAN domain-containing protein 3 [Acanthoscelides obtectus]
MKPSKLQDHLGRCHPDKTEKDLKYFQTLKDKFQKRPTLDRMFASTSQRNDDGLRASDKTAVEDVLKTVLHKPASDIIKRIPLSNNTFDRRIDEMSSDIETFLCNYVQTTHFSTQLDESTLPDNAALLLAYVRFIMNQEINEELLFARTLITDTKDFESRFEDILTMVMSPWIINPDGYIEETNVIIQEELTEPSTNEELKVQFKKGYQQFCLQNNIPVTYPLHGRDKKLAEMISDFKAFIKMLELWEQNLIDGDKRHFPVLSEKTSQSPLEPYDIGTFRFHGWQNFSGPRVDKKKGCYALTTGVTQEIIYEIFFHNPTKMPQAKKEENFRSSGTSGTEQDGSPIVEGSPIPKFNFFDLTFSDIVVRLTIKSQTLSANPKMRRFLI